jgi:2-keto-4-pentenoate hydratase/2-oxohepta-3-ene-1,7-dioic acid hydratase in catechol pathway
LRLLTYTEGGRTGVGVRVDGGIAATGYDDLVRLILDGAEGLRRARRAAEDGQRVEPERVLAPLVPGKIVCTGINYASHKEENPDAIFPDEPHFFSKFPSAVIGPGEAIVIPFEDSEVDYEVELALVVGRPAYRLTRENALAHVFGYTVLHDVSARDVQFRPNQLTLGKNPDTFCPLGPEVVTADDVPDPQALRIRTEVNGEERQNAATSDMLFDVATLLEHITRYVTLLPGDVVSTGTPAGCAAFRPGKPWLKPGDEVTVEVDAVGRLTNPVVAAW